MEYIRLKDVDIAGNINNRIFVKFMLLENEVRLQKDKVTKYIKLVMCDGEKRVDACKFGATQGEIDSLVNGKVYQAAVDIKEYAKSQSGFSCCIYNMEPISDDPNEYVAWADGLNDAFKTVQNALTFLNTGIYKNFVYSIVTENWAAFSTWSAASGMHHNLLGGLLVHTAEVIEIANAVADLWNAKQGSKFIDKHLLTAGALLHDIGKIKELSVDVNSGSTEYSTDSSLETHVTLGVDMITRKAIELHYGEQIETDKKPEEQLLAEQEALKLLKHCVYSHHGKKEYGAPIEPHCPEASIIHMADANSAEMFRYSKAFKEMNPGTSSTLWANGQMLVTYKQITKG